jgi:membrane dipeptidase
MRSPSVDLHADTLMAIVHEAHRLDGSGPVAVAELDAPRMRAGGLDAQFFSIFVTPYWEGAAAAARAHWLLDQLDAEIGRSGGAFASAADATSARAVVEGGSLAALRGIEGAHALGSSLERLAEFAARGVRYVTLTWANPNAWADSSGSPPVHGGLSDAGRPLVAEMERLGVLVDVSHVADSTFWDVVDVVSVPFIASHSSCRAIADHPRNLTDEQLRALGDSGGVVGINFHSAFLDKDRPSPPFIARWRGERPLPDPAEAELADRRSRPLERGRPTSLDRLADHVIHAVEIAGPDHVGLGSDFDGKIVPPVGLEDVGSLPHLRQLLGRRGLNEAELDAIWGGNVFRVLAGADARFAPGERSSP